MALCDASRTLHRTQPTEGDSRGSPPQRSELGRDAGLLGRSRRIIFTPAVELNDEFAKTAVQITCYDRDGKEVKCVTSSDDGNIDDGETEKGSGENSGTNTNSTSPSNGGEEIPDGD